MSKLRVAFTRPLLAVLLALAGLLLVAGCGSSDTAGGGGGTKNVAALGSDDLLKLLPKGTPVVLRQSTDVNSDQYKKLEALAARIPALRDAPQKIRDAINKPENADAKKFLAAAGDQVVVAVTDPNAVAAAIGQGVNGASGGAGAAQAPFLGLVDVKDPEAIKAALTTGDNPSKVVGNYAGVDLYQDSGSGSPTFAAVDENVLIISNTQAQLQQTIDKKKAGGESVLDDATFRDVAGKLPDGTVNSVFVNVAPFAAPITQLIQTGAGQTGQALPPGFDLGRIADSLKISFAIGTTAVDDGLDVVFASKSDATQQPVDLGNFNVDDLMGKAPKESFAAFGAQHFGAALRELLKNPAQLTGGNAQAQQQFDQGRQFLEAAGISIENDLLPIFDGQHLFYGSVVNGKPVGVVVLTQADASKTKATLDKLKGLAGPLLGASDPTAAQQAFVPVDIDGTEGTAIGSPDGPAYAIIDKSLVIGSTPDALRQFANHQGSLTDNPSYAQAKGDSGNVAAFLFADVPAIAATISQATGTQIPPDQQANIDAFSGIGFGATTEDGGRRSVGTLRIRVK